MKKIFRMALVLALSGAALLYTGCTKDYSEDINTLDKRLTDVETVQLKTIKDQIAVLQQAKTDLENADQKLQGLIDGLRNDLTNLQKTVTTLSEKHDKDVNEINTKIAKITGDIADLQKADIEIKARIKALEDEIVKKADITYVDNQIAALKDVYATITWVKEIETNLGKLAGRVTITENDIKDIKATIGEWDVEKDGTIKEAIDQIDKDLTKAINDIDQLQKDVVAAQKDATQALSETAALREALKLYYTSAEVDELLAGLKTYVDTQDAALATKIDEQDANLQKEIDSLAAVKLDLAKYQKDSAAIAQKVGEIDALLGKTITTMTLGFQAANERIDSVCRVMEQYKKDLEEAYKAADDVVRTEFQAADKEIEKAYKKADTEIWAAINAMDAAYKKADEILTSAINAEVSRAKKAEEDLGKEIQRVEREYKAADAQIIKDYKEADQRLEGLIGNLDKKVDDLQERLDGELNAIRGRLDVAEATLEKLWNRIQSVVYVPEYNDGKITVNSILLAEPESMKAEADEEETPAHEIEEFTEDLFIPAPTHVKYRVYGEKSGDIRNAIVKKFAEGNNVLSFDVVRVRTRANWNNAYVEILNVEKDDMMDDVLDITIRTMGFGDAFYWTAYKGGLNINYPGFVVPDLNAEYQSIGDLDEAPSFSMSLVVTDNEESKKICSCYNNIIPAVAGIVETSIVTPDPEDPTKLIDITGVQYGEEFDIEYTDTDPYEVLADARVNFKVDGVDYTYDEMIANGYAVPAIVWTATDQPDFTNSVFVATGQTVPEGYFHSVYTPFPATVNLASVQAGGVRSFDVFTYNYKVKNLSLNAYSKVTVVAVKAEVNTTIDDIVWTYKLDAAVDAARFNEAEEGTAYTRGTLNDASAVADGVAVTVNADDAANLAALGFGPADFKKLVPTEGTIKVTAKPVVDGVAGENDATVAAALEIVPDVQDGAVVAYLKGFEFDYAYTYEAQYELPNPANPAVTVTVKGTFNTVNRPGDVVITLPDETVPYEINLAKKIASDPVATLAENAKNPTNGLDELADVDDFIDAINNQASAYANYLKQLPATDFIDPANDTKIEFATPADPKAVNFDTYYDVNVPAFNGETIGNEFTVKTVATLWYGKKVTVIKSFVLDVDGLYDFEHIPEYVVYTNGYECYTSVQPKWQPNEVTTDITVPLEAYDVNEVKLNQHFRVVKGTGADKATITDVETGELPADEPIEREFWLEVPNADNVLADASHVDDPRPEAGVTGSKRPAGAVGIDLNNGEEIDNILKYYSKQDQIDVIGRLFAVNSNDETSNRIELTTSFNRVPGTENDYSPYVVKKYDPITDFKVLYENNSVDNPISIPVNNSIKTETSIYKFISLKDKRGFELIDNKNGTWLAGNGSNGFAEGTTTDGIFGLEFASTYEYITPGISPETQSRIKFDTKTGVLTYNNVLQTQLQKDIVFKLGINVEYPWGTRTSEVYVMFTNAPIVHVED